MRALSMFLVVCLSAGCAQEGWRRISVEGLGAIEQDVRPPEYGVDGSLRCADLRRQGCMISCTTDYRHRSAGASGL